MNELPSGWAKVSLGELGSWGSGGTPKRSNALFYSNGTIPWLVIGDLNGAVVTEAKAYITEEGFRNSSAKILPPGTLLIAMYGSIGKLGITGIECATNQAIAFCIPNQEIVNLRYLFHVLSYSKENLLSQGKGVAQQNISQATLKAHQIPLAPRKEQNQIAERLDALIEEVNACRELLDLILLSIKDFRRSVFSAAVKGELTSDWVYTDHPEEWQEVLIGDLLVDKPRNGYSPRSVEFQTQTRSLTLTATTSGKFDPQHVKYIDEIIPKNSYLWLEPNDILIQRANTIEYVGVSAIYDGPSKGYIYPDLMMKLRANNRVLTRFLYYLLSSEDMRTYFRKNATGTTGNMPKINQQTIMHAPVWIPCIDEQREIVRRTDLLITYTDDIKEIVQTTLEQVKQLTPVLLGKAFRGELISQNPSNEPASILLKRIVAPPQTTGEDMKKIPNSKLNSNNPSRTQPIKLTLENIKSSHLSDILRVQQDFMTAEMLWINSQLEIDDFYEQLKNEEFHGLLKEIREEASNSQRVLGII